MRVWGTAAGTQNSTRLELRQGLIYDQRHWNVGISRSPFSEGHQPLIPNSSTRSTISRHSFVLLDRQGFSLLFSFLDVVVVSFQHGMMAS